jgi:DNA-binding IclR family transcriptional regulator
MQGSKKNGSRGVQTIETAGVILNELARARGPLKLRDLAQKAGMVPAQLHPYLVSFRNMKLVEQNEVGEYQLGPFALHLGLTRLRNQNPYRETVRRVTQLADQLQLMIAITVWGLHGATIVYVQESTARIHADVRAGGVFMMTVTATGKTFAAFLPRAITESVIALERSDKEFMQRSRFEFDEGAYWTEVEEIARKGFATTLDMPIPGVSAVAAPVFDHTDKIQLVVTAIGPTTFIDLTENGPAVQGLLRFTRGLSADLGYQKMQE